jgi:hypothetical protein
MPFAWGGTIPALHLPLKHGQAESIPHSLVTEPSSMKGHNDPELRRRVPTSWTVYIWILIIFAVIALCGWIAGRYFGY